MNENELLLSVMVETYNQEEYITQTIESILKQDYSFPYEIIIGDDCSTDNTGKILDEYAEKYPQIKVIHNEKNLGAMGNFYTVLSQTKGKYIMDCGGDDYWLPGKVKAQIKFMQKHQNIGLCYGKVKCFKQNINELTKKSNGGKKTKFYELFLGNTIPALTVCYKKELVEKYLGEVNPQITDWRLEDLPMWLWFARKSKIKFLNKEFGVYRVLEESESHSKNSEKYQKYAKSCRDVRVFYSELYNESILLQLFDYNNEFNKAWREKEKKQIIQIGKNLLKIHFSFKIMIKILIAKFFK